MQRDGAAPRPIGPIVQFALEWFQQRAQHGAAQATADAVDDAVRAHVVKRKSPKHGLRVPDGRVCKPVRQAA